MGLFDGLFRKKEEDKIVFETWKREEESNSQCTIHNAQLDGASDKVENNEEHLEEIEKIEETQNEESGDYDGAEENLDGSKCESIEDDSKFTTYNIDAEDEDELIVKKDLIPDNGIVAVASDNADKVVNEIIEEAREEAKEEIKKEGFFQKLVMGLSKTKNSITQNIDNVLKNFVKIDEELFEELEEQLIMADIGVAATMDIIADLREKAKDGRLKEPSEIKELLKKEITRILIGSQGVRESGSQEDSKKVMLIIGVNGVGKTTSVGKLASKYRREGKKVLLAAADTFRAAAIEQLTEWANRANIELIKHNEGADPGAVVFDAIAAAKARKTELLIVDTAGRLHNKKNLMDELRKIYKIIDKEYPEAEKEMMLVLDATTGQNALQQAKLFGEIVGIDGLILTKLDGTAKGGIVVAISKELNIPVRYIGVGEGIEDLQEFDAGAFAAALFE